MDDIGPEGRLRFFTIASQKQRGHSRSKFNFEADSLMLFIEFSPVVFHPYMMCGSDSIDLCRDVCF